MKDIIKSDLQDLQKNLTMKKYYAVFAGTYKDEEFLGVFDNVQIAADRLVEYCFDGITVRGGWIETVVINKPDESGDYIISIHDDDSYEIYYDFVNDDFSETTRKIYVLPKLDNLADRTATIEKMKEFVLRIAKKY